MAHSIHLSTLTSQDPCDLYIHFHKNAQYLNIFQGRIMQLMVGYESPISLPLIISPAAGTPKSELASAGQPPRILSPEEQEKMRTVCRVRIAFSFYISMANLFDYGVCCI